VIVLSPTPPAFNALEAAIEHWVESFEGLHDQSFKPRSRAAATSNALSLGTLIRQTSEAKRPSATIVSAKDLVWFGPNGYPLLGNWLSIICVEFASVTITCPTLDRPPAQAMTAKLRAAQLVKMNSKAIT
jgi:hypothetical protein